MFKIVALIFALIVGIVAAVIVVDVKSTVDNRTKCEQAGGVYLNERYCVDLKQIDIKSTKGN